MKKLLSFLLVLAMLFTSVIVVLPANAVGGDEIGSVPSGYEQTLIDAGYTAISSANQITSSGKYYLAEDITFAGNTQEDFFKNGALSGTVLDGNGHKVTWGTESNPAKDSVFDGWENNVTIKNITIEGYIKNNVADYGGSLTADFDANVASTILFENCVFDIDQVYDQTGFDARGNQGRFGLIGKWQTNTEGSSLTFRNVINKGDIIMKNADNSAVTRDGMDWLIGGFLPENESSFNTPITFENCTYAGKIDVNIALTAGKVLNIGGFVGKTTGSNMTIDGCKVNGSGITVNGTRPDESNGSCIGGLVGYMLNAPTFTNNVTTNASPVTVGCRARVGGIVGKLDSGTLNNVTNSGDVTATGGNVLVLGGVVASLGSGCTIDNVKNSGDVTAKAKIVWGKLAGIAADITTNVTITNTENSGNVVNENTDTPDGNSSMGGIVGYAQSGLTLGSTTGPVKNSGNIVSGKTNYPGGIIGWVTGGTITNVVNEGKVTVNAGGGSNLLGGVAARVTGATSFTNVTNSGDVTANASIGWGKAGGIVGDIDVAGCTMTNVKNSGNITGVSGTMNNGEGGLGGIVGGLPKGATVANCINNGLITYSGTGDINVGGCFGIVKETANISKCINTKDVSTSVCRAGGIIGAVAASPEISITDCYNAGNVTAPQYTGGIVATTHFKDVGGTTGKLVISNSVNIGAIVSDSWSAGGIVGVTQASDANSVIDSCVNAGTVTIKGTSARFGDSWRSAAGILAAVGGNIKVTNCVNIGTISSMNKTNTGAHEYSVFPIMNYSESINGSIETITSNSTGNVFLDGSAPSYEHTNNISASFASADATAVAAKIKAINAYGYDLKTIEDKYTALAVTAPKAKNDYLAKTWNTYVNALSAASTAIATYKGLDVLERYQYSLDDAYTALVNAENGLVSKTAYNTARAAALADSANESYTEASRNALTNAIATQDAIIAEATTAGAVSDAVTALTSIERVAFADLASALQAAELKAANVNYTEASRAALDAKITELEGLVTSATEQGTVDAAVSTLNGFVLADKTLGEPSFNSVLSAAQTKINDAVNYDSATRETLQTAVTNAIADVEDARLQSEVESITNTLSLANNAAQPSNVRSVLQGQVDSFATTYPENNYTVISYAAAEEAYNDAVTALANASTSADTLIEKKQALDNAIGALISKVAYNEALETATADSTDAKYTPACKQLLIDAIATQNANVLAATRAEDIETAVSALNGIVRVDMTEFNEVLLVANTEVVKTHIYTPETIETLELAITAQSAAANNATTLEAINNAKTALQTAIDGLVESTVAGRLENQVAEFDKGVNGDYNPDNFTTLSYNELSVAIEDAREALAQEPAVEVGVLNGLETALDIAINNLISIEAYNDKAAVAAELAAQTTVYTAESILALEQAMATQLANAKAATAPENVEDAVTALQTAIDALVSQVSVRLNAVIADFDSAERDYPEINYATTSYGAYEVAVEAARQALAEDASISVLDEKEDDIEAAINALVDITAFNALLATAQNEYAKDTVYTVLSRAALLEAINTQSVNAKAALDDGDVEDAINALQTAIDGLEESEVRTNLENAIENIPTLYPSDNYTASSYSELTSVKNDIIDALADSKTTIEDLDNWLVELNKAIDELVSIEELKQAIDGCDPEDERYYTAESFEEYVYAYNDASYILNKADATPKEIEDATNALVNAYSALVLVEAGNDSVDELDEYIYDVKYEFDESHFTPEAWIEFQNALADAYAIDKTSTLLERDAAYAALNTIVTKMLNLSDDICADADIDDFGRLDEVIEAACKLDADDYFGSAYAELEYVIAQAQGAYSGLTKVAEVDEWIEKLESAMAALVEVPADKLSVEEELAVKVALLDEKDRLAYQMFAQSYLNDPETLLKLVNAMIA